MKSEVTSRLSDRLTAKLPQESARSLLLLSEANLSSRPFWSSNRQRNATRRPTDEADNMYSTSSLRASAQPFPSRRTCLSTSVH